MNDPIKVTAATRGETSLGQSDFVIGDVTNYGNSIEVDEVIVSDGVDIEVSVYPGKLLDALSTEDIIKYLREKRYERSVEQIKLDALYDAAEMLNNAVHDL